MTLGDDIERYGIPQVMLRYAAMLDDNDVPGILSCFGDQAHVELLSGAIVLDGRAELERHYERTVAERRSHVPELGSMHSVANTVLLGEDRYRVLTRTVGTVHSYTSVGEPVTARGLKYLNSLEQVQGRWRITRMIHETLWEAQMAGPESVTRL